MCYKAWWRIDQTSNLISGEDEHSIQENLCSHSPGNWRDAASSMGRLSHKARYKLRTWSLIIVEYIYSVLSSLAWVMDHTNSYNKLWVSTQTILISVNADRRGKYYPLWFSEPSIKFIKVSFLQCPQTTNIQHAEPRKDVIVKYKIIVLLLGIIYHTSNKPKVYGLIRQCLGCVGKCM